MAGKKFIFISYSSHDFEAAQRIMRALESRGFACWISSRDVPPGGNFASAIVEAIENAYAMVLVFSANANQRAEEIKKEIVLAGQSQLVVLPARIENLLPSDRAFRYEMATRQWVDLFDNWDAGIDRMVSQLAKLKPADATVMTPTATARAAEAEENETAVHIKFRVRRRGLVIGAAAAAGAAVAGAGGWYAWQVLQEGGRQKSRDLTAEAQRSMLPGQYPRAIELLDQAIQADDQNVEAWRMRGSASLFLGKLQDGVRNYTEVVRLDPTDGKSWRLLGRSYLSLNDPHAARRALETAVKLRPGSVMTLTDRANARFNASDPDGALADLNEAVRTDARYAEAWRMRAYIYATRNEFDRAWPDFDQAIRLEPRNPYNFQLRGQQRQRAGDTGGAAADRAQAQALGGAHAPMQPPPNQPRR